MMRTLLVAGPMALAGCSDGLSGGLPLGGTLKQGLRDAERALDQGDAEEALARLGRMEAPGPFGALGSSLDQAVRGASPVIRRPVQSLATIVGLGQLSAEARAELAFARGLVLARTEAPAKDVPEVAGEDEAAEPGPVERAVRAFETARSLGGAPRPHAVEALGTIQMAVAEALRLEIPELSGAPGGGPAGGPPQAADEDAPDPIEVARAAYLGARSHYVEALRLGLDSESLEANVDLCIRRLRELDELERQRQEQQDESENSESEDKENENKDESSESEEKDPEKDPAKSDDPKSEDEPKEDPSKSDSPPEDETQREPAEDPKEDDGESSEENPSEEEQPEKEPGEPGESEEQPESSAQEQAPPESQIEEKRMTAEELKRLLEASREYQEQGEKQRVRLRRLRRIPAKRDW